MAKKEKKKKDKKAKDEGEAEADAKEEGKEEAKEEAKEAPKEGAEGEAPAEGAEGEAPKKGKKKLIIIIAAAVLLIGAIVGILFGVGVIGGGGEGKEGGKTEEAKGPVDEDGKPIIAKPVYYELPEFLVNLSASNNRVSFLKMSVTLELKDEASVAVLDANKPRILDAFNTYLRELKASDVQGSAGIYRLRDELMTRINGTVEEGLVKDILFSEIIVQ